jgi:hypothetical protein
MPYDDLPAKLFWTGGWDSTFRLLQLVLVEKRPVQPYYLIDPKRQSLRNEIKACRDIKERLFKECPLTRDLILPTIYYEVGDLKEDEELLEAYHVFMQFKVLDTQYLWLSLFCKQMGLSDMELGVEGVTQSVKPIERRVWYSILVPIEGTRQARIADEFKDTVVQTLFGFFRFPIRGYTRAEMETEAQVGGWLDYLYMTWFCHCPVQGKYPCGTCDPCHQVIIRSYGKRIPWQRRLYAKLGLEKSRQRVANIARKINPHFHQWKR